MSNFQDLADCAFDSIKSALGQDAIYKTKNGASFSVRGVFSDNHVEVDPDTERLISSNVYAFGMKLKDIPIQNFKPQKGDRLVYNQETYRVIDSREDGVPGVSTELILHKEC